jgi:hypothetical protein
LCFMSTVIIKHRQCLAFWSWRLAFHCTRSNFLICTLSRPTGNWFIFIVSCTRGCPKKVKFSSQSHTQTLCGILPS